MTPRLGSLSAWGVAKEATYGTPVAATNFTPFTGSTINPDFGLFFPKTMMGQRTTQIYALQGEAKFNGNCAALLYPINGVMMLVGSIGADASAYNGVTGTATVASTGSPGTAGSSTSFASTGVTSITATSIAGTFAANQVILISGSTDTAGPETVICSNFSSPTLTVSATTKIHTGTISLTTVGAKSNGSVSAGGGSISLQTGLGALFTTNDIVQIDLNVAGSTSSEIHKVSVATDTLTITDSSPNNVLLFAHAAGIQVFHVAANYTHTVPLGPTISSFTVEKNLGNFQSEQYAGTRVAKYSLKAPMGNSPVNFTADLMAQSVTVLDSPTAVVIDSTGLPFTFKECTLTWNAVNFNEGSNFALDLNNTVKAYYTYSANAGPSELPSTDLIVNGSFDVIWSSDDDATRGLFTKAQNLTQAAVTFTIAHSNGMEVLFTMPQVNLKVPKADPKPGELILQTIGYEASLNISATYPSTITATIVNSSYTPIA